MDPGVCPRNAIAANSKPSNSPMSPSPTGLSVATSMSGASSAPATVRAPLAATTAANARTWSQCECVVITACSFGGRPSAVSALADASIPKIAGASSAASMSTWLPLVREVSR